MTFVNYDDNRIVIASLECLQVLFKLMPFKFHLFLLKSGSMSESFVNAKYLSLTKKINQDNLDTLGNLSVKNMNLDLSDSHLNMSMIDITTQKITDSSSTSCGSVESLNTLKLSSNSNQQQKMTTSILDLNNEFSLETQLDSLPVNNPLMQANDNAETKTLVEQGDVNSLMNDEFDVSNLNFQTEHLLDEKDITFPFKATTDLIGNFYSMDKQPIVYFVRLLAYKYLFNLNFIPDDDSKNLTKLKPDSECKVLVKAIALDCCASCITLQPNIIFNSLFTKMTDQTIGNLFFYDLICYVNHSDDKMRTTACLLIGQLISSVIGESDGNYDYWLEKNIENR